MKTEPFQLLLVEDDDAHAEIIRRTVQRSGINCETSRVSDGEQAIAYLRREGVYADRPRPNLVLLDLKLPKLSGHEVLAKVKNDVELCVIPVVVLSTSNTVSDRAEAYRHHANSYLVKPDEFDQFRQMINDLGVYWGTWNEPAPELLPG